VTIDTKAFGEIEVSEKQRIYFSEGILGFDYIKEYYLLDMEDSPFYSLQAFKEKDMAFILIQPEYFIKDYKLVVPQSDFDALEIKGKDDLLDFAIVTIPDDPRLMTANLQGPVIINRHTRQARQVISLNEKYSTRHPLLDELEQKSGGDD